MRKSQTRITHEATVSATDERRAQQLFELATTEPDLLRDSVREALSQLSEEERRAVHNGLLLALREAGINIAQHLFVLGIPARTAEELTAPEIATLIRYIRISAPGVMAVLASILADVLGKRAAPAQRVKPSRRAA
jgi:hypothetical protein